MTKTSREEREGRALKIMEYKTCEEYVLGQLAEAEEKITELEERLKESQHSLDVIATTALHQDDILKILKEVFVVHYNPDAEDAGMTIEVNEEKLSYNTALVAGEGEAEKVSQRIQTLLGLFCPEIAQKGNIVSPVVDLRKGVNPYGIPAEIKGDLDGDKASLELAGITK